MARGVLRETVLPRAPAILLMALTRTNSSSGPYLFPEPLVNAPHAHPAVALGVLLQGPVELLGFAGGLCREQGMTQHWGEIALSPLVLLLLLRFHGDEVTDLITSGQFGEAAGLGAGTVLRGSAGGEYGGVRGGVGAHSVAVPEKEEHDGPQEAAQGLHAQVSVEGQG